MKKRLLLLFLVLLTPLFVFADDAGPSILGYDAVIINKDGVKNLDTYEDDKYKDYVIKYNTKVYVYDERYNNDEKVAFAEVKLPNGETRTFLISLKDIMPVKSEIIPTDKDAKNEDNSIEKKSSRIIAFDKNGLKLKKGPADIYGTYDDVIPYKKELKTTFVIEGYKGDPKWYYVDDGKYHGWVDVSWDTSSAVAYLEESTLVFGNTKMVDDDNKLIGEIPSETLLTEIYYINSLNKHYVRYGNQEGYVGVQVYDNNYYKNLYEFNPAWKVNGSVLTLKDTKITSFDGKERIKIPFGEKVTILYASYYAPEYEDAVAPQCVTDTKCLYYVEYKNVKGFLDANDAFSLIDGKKMTLSLSDDTKMYGVDLYYEKYSLDDEHFTYDEFKEKYKINKIIPAGTSVTSYEVYEYSNYVDDEEIKDTWYLVKYDGSIGFITPNSDVKKEVVEEPIKEIDTPKPKPREKKRTINDTLIYGIIGALIVSLASIVTIILVNKKNKKISEKNESIEEKKEEVKEVKKETLKEENVKTEVNEKKIVKKDSTPSVPKKKVTKRNVTIKDKKELKKED